jgi:hypothetical protein
VAVALPAAVMNQLATNPAAMSSPRARLKIKNPKAPAVKREAEEDWGSPHWIKVKNPKGLAVTREAEENWG